MGQKKIIVEKFIIVKVNGYNYLRQTVQLKDLKNPENQKEISKNVYQRIQKDKPTPKEKAKLEEKVNSVLEQNLIEHEEALKKYHREKLGLKDFNSMYLEYIDVFRSAEKKENTQNLYKSRFKYYIESYFKGYDLTDLNATLIQKLFNKMATENSKKTGKPRPYSIRCQIYNDLQSFLNFCLENDYIAKNPMNCIKRPSNNEEQNCKIITENQLNIVLEQVKTSKTILKNHQLGILIAAAEGLREEEIMGICLEHYDAENKILKVHRTVASIRNNPNFKLKASSKMKSFFSRRTIKIEDETAAAIDEYIASHDFKKNPDGFTYLFQNENGGFLSPQNLGAAYYKIIFTLKKHGAIAKDTPSGLHNMRKFLTQKLKNEGIPTEIIARKLGHDPNTNNRIYTNNADLIIDANQYRNNKPASNTAEKNDDVIDINKRRNNLQRVI